MKSLLSLFLLIVTLLFSSRCIADTYAVTHVKGNVYRFTAGHYHSIFITTNKGTIVTDPINKAAGKYLYGYLKQNELLPVKYMIYSHNHTDHVSGGNALAQPDTQVIAHRLAADDIAFTRIPTRLPDITFSDELQLKLGNSHIRLRYHGENNGKSSISYTIEPEEVLYVVDWIVLGRLPYKNLPGYDIAGMINSVEDVLQRAQFDIFVGGHADIGNRADVQTYLRYLRSLYHKVNEGMQAGKTLSELQSSIQLDEFQHLKMYDEWLAENIAGVYKTLVNESYFNYREDLATQY